MKDFVCKKCGNTTYIVQEKSNGTGLATGLYCAKCGFWHKWLNKQEKVLYSSSNGELDKDKEITRLTAENERLTKEIARLSHENDELKSELQKLKPDTQRKATDKMIEYAKIIASYTNKPLPDFNNFDETQDYIRNNRQLYLERLEIDSEANMLVIDSRRDE